MKAIVKQLMKITSHLDLKKMKKCETVVATWCIVCEVNLSITLYIVINIVDWTFIYHRTHTDTSQDLAGEKTQYENLVYAVQTENTV